MEIESMNFYDENTNEGDQIRRLIQKHKKDFEIIRKEMRQ